MLLFRPLTAQTNYANEEELKKAATEAFDAEDFQKAFPLYAQLVANYPKDVNYNYRVGVCMLFASNEKDKALEYLQNASKNATVEKEVWFYLGRAYHLGYRFDEAITAYTKYKQLAGDKKAEKMQVDNQLAMCRTGKKLLRAITDITVLDKKELTSEDFFRSYDLSGYSGKLLVKPDDFKTSLDKKKKENSVIFLSGEKTEIYFSSYGNDESNGKDIYLIKKLPNGQWSKPQNVGYPINTEYDEDYPFLHPNGKVLYFCSKGHNSMGGYDIFKSTLNEETNTWTKPVNLDFAINTPDDDILFVTDMDESTAYFSSSRNSKAGFQTVFHVRLDRKPVDQCIIKGTFAAVEGTDNRGANILVKSMDDGSVVGQFKSNSKNGDYLLTLPNGGKFMVTVDKPGQPTQSQPMIIPPQYEIKTLRQEMGYGSVSGQAQLYINTLFDDDTTGLSPDFLRKRANLDPNDDVVPTGPIAKDIDTLHAGTDPIVKSDGSIDTTQTVASTSGTDGGTPPIKKDISTGDLLKLAKEDAAQTDQEAKDLDNQANQALAYVDDQNKKAKATNALADAAQGDADRESDPTRKKALQAKADSLRGEADVYENNTVAAYSIAEALRRDADTKKKQSKLAGDYAKGLETYSKNNNPKLLDQLKQQEEDLQAYDDVKSDAEESVAGLQQQASAKKRADEKAHEDAGTIQGELDDLNKEIGEKEAAAAAEKDPQLKSGYVDQINDLKADRTEKEGEKKKADALVAQLDADANSLDAQALLAAQLLTKTKTGDASPTAIASINKNEIAESVKEYSREIAESPETRTFRPIDTSVPVVKSDGGSNPTAVDTSNTAAATTTVSTTPVEDLTKRFDGPLTDANTNSDPLASETAKGQVYHDWEKAIDQEIVKQQQAQAKTKDKKEKDAIAKNITALKQQKKEKHDLAVQSDRKADDLRKTALVKNDPPDTTHNGGINPDSANTGITLASTPETLTKQFSDPLSDAENGKDPLAVETAKGQVYHDWETAIDQAIADQQKAQSKTRDKKEKDAIGKNIAALKQQKKEKHDLAVASDRKAEDLRKTSLVKNDPPDTTHGTGTTDPIVKNDGGTGAVDTNATSDAGSDPNARFVADLASADTITKTSDREQHKADVQTAWAAAIDKTIGEKKDQLGKTTDKTEKDQLKKDIAALQRESAQHKQDAKTATSVASRARQQEESQPTVATTSTIDPPFIASMKSADAQTDPYTRDSVKAQVYNDWATALESASAKATDDAAKNRDKKKKVQLQQQATFYDSLAREKHDLAAEATQRAETAHTVADSGNPSTVTTPGDPALYTEPSAGTQRKNSIHLHAEATFYKTSADSLRSLASDPANAGRRDELLADAATADQKAADAEAASDKADADAATTQYTSNNDKLKKYIHLSAESTVPAVTQAALLSDEADTYFKKAQEKRSEAGTTTSDAVREEAIRDAEKMEAIAIQKQALALNTFTNTYPGDINQLAKNDGGSNPIKNDGGTDPIVKNDGGSNPIKNDGGTDPIVKNDGGSNPIKNDGGTDPIVKNDGGSNPIKNDGSTDPIVKNDGGTAKTATTVVNPITSQPFTPQELSQVRSSESFRNYTSTKQEADQMDAQAKAQRKQADDFHKASDAAIASSQNLLSQAADQNDPTQKQKLLDRAKEENARGLTYKAKADSVNELADNTEASARSKSGEADLFLNDIDHSTYTPEQMKAVAAADRKASEPVSDGGSDPIVKNDGGSNPIKNDGGTDPIVKNDGGTSGNDGGASTTSTPGDNATFSSKNKSTIVNRLSKSDTYVLSTTTDYSTTKPIPVDQSIPQGLMYRVQIGAFRNPIPQDLFKGISPINGERTASGVTRYTAGQFTAFTAADAAKNEIRSLGYPDAFVVAFYNGKRISVGEAQALSNGTGSNPVATSGNNGGASSGNNGGSSNGNNGGTTSGNDGGTSGSNNGGSSSENTGSTSRPVADNSIAPTTDVQNVNGTFFTVQVGVYSRPVSKAKLYNLGNLFTERLPNGNIRYCSGIYYTADDAIAAKNQIVTLGISDAFVTAYSDGQRVSILQARSGSTGTTPSGNTGGSITTPSGNNGGSSDSGSSTGTTSTSGSSDSGTSTGTTSTSGSSDSGTSTGTTSTSGSSDSGSSTGTTSTSGSSDSGTSTSSTGTSSDAASTPVSKPLTALTDSGLVYKVQIGAFREQVPIEIANKFIRIANRGVKSAVDSETGLTVYTCGGYTTYTDADVLREEAVSKGLNDAFVVAFLNGKKITVEEAKKISGQ